MPADEPTLPDPTLETTPQNRRTFVQILTGLLGLLLNVIPATLGGMFFLDPLFRRRKEGDFIPLGITSDTIPNDGSPVAVTVIADQSDAWNLYKDVPVGSIWVRKKNDGSLVAFSSTCPHLGCSVDYRASNNDFYCPCHTSAFDLDGAKKNVIPPRGMDELDIRTDDSGQLLVNYQEFLGGTEQKKPV
ncbi:MAG: Rieske 2Fe-2S domain-containing protein [Fuerstiella sp.]|nr:Rieske 2Fe-2S domain-containing protein [Fuerstiella sp.]